MAVAAVCAFQTPTAAATEQFSPTVVRHKDGKWQLQGDYLGGWRIFIVATDNKPKLDLRIQDAIPKEDYEKYVDDTTAGPVWETYALSYFVTIDAKTYFCIRTWWDRRIVIDLAAAKQVADRGMGTALEAAEKEAVLDILKGGVAVVSKEKIALAPFFRLQAAIHLAGRMKEKKAVPWLRKLEPLGFETSSTTDLKVGGLFPQNYSTHELRRVVHLSLRRLGETPAALPITSFSRHGADKAFEPRKWDGPRSERVASVKIAMSPTDVLNILGAPDYVEKGQNIHREGPWEVAWRYDMDAQPGYTLLLVWNDQKIKNIEKVSPALWDAKVFIRGEVKPALLGADGSIRNVPALYSDAFEGKITHLK
jgi:hypothetical protein